MLLCPFSLCAQVQPGNEVLAANGFKELQGKRVGLITNPSGVNRKGFSTIDLLRDAPGVKLVALFGPEHGVNGDVKAGEHIRDKTDKRTGLPIYSLYGAVRKPTPSMLKGLDALVYDLQDTGARSYTYISTMGLAMEACAEAGVEFVVLDRPNPLGGERVEGPLIEDRFRSFVGRWDIPYVYGMTCGELARMINGESWIKKSCKLTVIPMKGWRRSMVWRDTGLPWVPTSPNIPRPESPLYYAATGLFGEIAGGSGINIGSVFKRPFECVTASWLDANKLSREMNHHGLAGISFPVFTVTHAGRRHQGVEIKFAAPARAPLVAINFYLLDAVRKVSGRDLFVTALKAGKSFDVFDKVTGSDSTRAGLHGGQSAGAIAASWKPGEEAFRQKRQKYLLYYDVPTREAPLVTSSPPASIPARPVTPPPAYLIVTVSKDDTIYKLADDFGVTVSDIAEANPGRNVAKLKRGQKLKIPRAIR
jgi:uncharacterized protein YbbC (DUF1343 family)